MHSIRGRLIISHIIPLLVVSPLIGLTIYYLLQTQRELTSLSGELTRQAQTVAQLAQTQPDIFTDVEQAQLFVEVFPTENPNFPAVRITILHPAGHPLASSVQPQIPENSSNFQLPDASAILAEREGYLRLQADLAHVVVPIVDAQDELLGLISLTTELDSVTARVPLLRSLLLGALVLELLLAMILGLLLAWYFERDLRAVTAAVANISFGQTLDTLPERGPSEFRELIRAYNVTIERLKTLESARRQLLANLVHELRRPLGAMQAAIQALSQGAGKDVEFRQELLEGMQAQINRLRPLLDNLAELHGQVLGSLELERTLTALTPWLRQVAIPWQAAAEEKELRWTMNVPNELPSLAVDADRLEQAVGNLLSNAVKYTPPGGMVQLVAEATDKNVIIRIRDTGPGIPTDEQSRIFIPFYRSHTESRFPQGMGLGLTIAHDIISAHGGQLELESVHNQGSEFIIYLPLSE